MWYFNKDSGNFSVGSIPTVEVDGEMIEEQGWELIQTRPEPHDNYVFDGEEWVEKPNQILSVSELKKIGKEYNGYQVPLDEEAQIAVTSVTMQHLAGMFSETIFYFSNGVKMPCTQNELMPFAKWFVTERNKFFLE